jgi:hypothetical protein
VGEVVGREAWMAAPGVGLGQGRGFFDMGGQ